MVLFSLNPVLTSVDADIKAKYQATSLALNVIHFSPPPPGPPVKLPSPH